MMVISKKDIRVRLKPAFLGCYIIGMYGCSGHETAPVTTKPSTSNPAPTTISATRRSDERDVKLLLTYEKSGGVAGIVPERLVVGTDKEEIIHSRVKYQVDITKEYVISAKQVDEVLTILKDHNFYKLGEEKTSAADMYQLKITIWNSHEFHRAIEYQGSKADDPSRPIIRIIDSIKLYLEKNGSDINK